MVDDTPLMSAGDTDEEAANNNTPGEGVEVAGVTLDAAQLPQFLVFVSSIILLIATGAAYKWSFDTSYSGYALSISIIAMILSVFGIALMKTPNDVYAKVGTPLNMLIFSYCFIGACFLTFDGPFTTTSNGYFASWAIVYGSGLAIGMSSLHQSGVKGLGCIMGLAASSLIVIIATINPIRYDNHRNESIFALVLACVTFVFLLLAAKMGATTGTGYFLVISILAMCWIVEASLVTFRGPFTATGNGYFGSWTGALTASIAAFAAMRSL